MKQAYSMLLSTMWTLLAFMNSMGSASTVAKRGVVVTICLLFIRNNYITLANLPKVPKGLEIANLFSLLSTICAGTFLAITGTYLTAGLFPFHFIVLSFVTLILMFSLTRRTHVSRGDI